MLVDDHEVVRVGLRSLLSRVPRFRIVAEAGTAEDAVRTVRQLAAGDGHIDCGNAKDRVSRIPDIIVMDVRLPDGSGVDACRAIRSQFPDVKVIMLTSYSDDEAIFASVMAGAAGYVLKQIGSEELIRAIQTVYAGGSLLDPETTNRVLEHVRSGKVLGREGGAAFADVAQAKAFAFARRAMGAQRDVLSDLPEPLTDQEQRILSLISHGKTNREIAEEIFLSEKTVRNYVSNILGKLNLSNRAEAAAFAVRHGIATPSRV